MDHQPDAATDRDAEVREASIGRSRIRRSGEASTQPTARVQVAEHEKDEPPSRLGQCLQDAEWRGHQQHQPDRPGLPDAPDPPGCGERTERATAPPAASSTPITPAGSPSSRDRNSTVVDATTPPNRFDVPVHAVIGRSSGWRST